MPPLRPLPDLCLISVFKMLTPNEQLVASKMSPRCAVLMRAANRTGKTLVVTSQNFYEANLSLLTYKINYFSFASKPSMKLLMDIPGETFPDYPMTTRLSKWNILRLDQLRLINTATIEQIVTLFSAVTDLKLMTISSKHITTLVSLLQHPNWKCQLTNLMVEGTHRMDSQLSGELIPAINGLTALQLLALDWDNYSELPDLPILAQLKTVVFSSNRLSTFLRSLERNATDNATDLEVHLLSRATKALLTLSQPLRSRIVRYGWAPLDYTRDQVPLLCSQFRSLTSLALRRIDSTKVGPLFTDLSQLPQLIHLKFGVDFSEVNEEFPLSARPRVQLDSVRALDLHLRITSHSQIEWLNLPWAMPNLKTIYINFFRCDSCEAWFSRNNRQSFLLSSLNFLNCFRLSLFNLHPGVPRKRFILPSNEEFQSAEELLLQS